jgi:sarcosine oxidase
VATRSLPNPHDVIVAGLGAHGSSAAYRLAARGASVLGFDRFARGHTLGSSGGLSRIIRLSYYEHPDYVPLLRRAWTLWRELERESGEQLLTETGGLYAGDPDGELVAGALESARRYRLEHEVLDTAALRERYPLFEWLDGWQGVFERQAGWLAPERSIETHNRLAEQNGATLRFAEPVERWESTGDGVRVTTATGTFEGKQLVLAAGAWESQLAALARAGALRRAERPLLVRADGRARRLCATAHLHRRGHRSDLLRLSLYRRSRREDRGSSLPRQGGPR